MIRIAHCAQHTTHNTTNNNNMLTFQSSLSWLENLIGSDPRSCQISVHVDGEGVVASCWCSTEPSAGMVLTQSDNGKTYLVSEVFEGSYDHNANDNTSAFQVFATELLPEYVQIGPAPEGSADRFIAELRDMVAVWPQAQHLVDAVDNHDLKVSVFAPCEQGDVEEFFPMLVGHVDFKLEKLGERFGICRGFPFRWVPGELVRCFGFREKFKNDDRQAAVKAKFDALAGFVKLSGYLSHLLTWVRKDGTPCWSAFSKNSGDSTLTLEEARATNSRGGFASDAARIWSPIVSTRLILDLEKFGMHVCAETLSLNDAAHGAVPRNNIPVVTTMGRGVVAHKGAHGWELANHREKGYVSFAGFKDTIEVCKAYGLPVCSAVIATGPAAKMIMERLGSGPERDHMTYLRYMALVAEVSAKYPELLVVYEGSHDHMELLGNCLEGLVLHVIEEGTEKTHDELVGQIESGLEVAVEKWKLPGYTGRTMGIREAIKKGFLKNLGEFDAFITSWAEWWCISPEGIEYWRDFYWKVALLGHQEDPNPDHQVCRHIRLCDQVHAEWEILDKASLKTEREKVSLERARVIEDADPVLVGPCTIVVPGAKDFSEIERVLKTNYVESTTKKPKKSWTGYARLTSTPCRSTSDTGPVYMLPLGASAPEWLVKKYEEFKDSATLVVNVSKLVPAIHQTIRQKNAAEVAKAGVITPMEQELRDEIDRVIRRLEKDIEPSPLGIIHRPKVFLPIAPQCMGKSRVFEALKGKIEHCSADYYMGKTFDWTRLPDCHFRCAMDVVKAIENGRDSWVDNTNLKGWERAIYHEICRVMNAELVPIVILPERWLISDNFDEILETLVVRAHQRARETGKTLGDDPRGVIVNAITNSRADYRASSFCDKDVSPLNTWLNWAPVLNRAMGISIEKGRTLLFRSEELLSQIGISLTDPVLSGPVRTRQRLLTQMKRGYGEGHITIVGPTERERLDKALAKKIQKPAGLAEELALHPAMELPEYKGIGCASDAKGHEVFYLVYHWPWAQKLRESWGLTDSRDFHATVLWTGENDIHGVGKGIDTLVRV